MEVKSHPISITEQVEPPCSVPYAQVVEHAAAMVAVTLATEIVRVRKGILVMTVGQLRLRFLLAQLGSD